MTHAMDRALSFNLMVGTADCTGQEFPQQELPPKLLSAPEQFFLSPSRAQQLLKTPKRWLVLKNSGTSREDSFRGSFLYPKKWFLPFLFSPMWADCISLHTVNSLFFESLAHLEEPGLLCHSGESKSLSAHSHYYSSHPWLAFGYKTVGVSEAVEN